MPLYCSRNKIKRKENQIKENRYIYKIKVQAYYNIKYLVFHNRNTFIKLGLSQ